MVVRWMVVAFAAAQGPCALRRGVAFPPGGGEAPRLKVAEDNVHGLSPYTLVGISGSALLEPGSSCDSPSHGDVVVGAAKAKVFNGTLANAVEAWRLDSNFQKASESYVFPVVDDAADGDGDGAGESFGLKGWMVVRFEPLANAPVAFAPAAAGGRDRKLVDRAVEALEKKKVAEFKSLAEMHALAAAAALSKAAELQRKLDEARLVVEAAERLRIEEEAEAVLVLERSRVDAAKAKIRAAELQAKRSDEDKAKQALEALRLASVEKERLALDKLEAEKVSAAAALKSAEGRWGEETRGWMASRGEDAQLFVIFEATFPVDRGPLGMSFDVSGRKPATVNVVSATGHAAHATVAVGDELVELRYTSKDGDGTKRIHANTTALGAHGVLEHLKTAGWPRTMVLRRKRPAVEAVTLAPTTAGRGSSSAHVLRITFPDVLRGEYEAVAADWAPLFRAVEDCRPQQLLLADPLDGCNGVLYDKTKDADRVSLFTSGLDKDDGTDAVKPLALTVRGKCTFVDKAKALKDSAAGLLIYNNAAGFAPMPGGGIKTDDLENPVGMLSQSLGILLSRSVPQFPKGVLAWFGPRQACPDLVPKFKPPPERVGRMDFSGDEKPTLTGTLLLQCRGHTASFKHAVAFFGEAAPDLALPVVASVPEHLCQLAGVERRLAGAIAIVERGGGCSFGDKAMIAQKLGASALVVVNNGAGPRREAVEKRTPSTGLEKRLSRGLELQCPRIAIPLVDLN